MRRVVVLGGGPVGLCSAMLLARAGCAVTVLEQDAEDRPSSPADAWDGWERAGVPHFRQPHNLFARFRQVLDDDLPDVRDRLVDAGCHWRDPLAEQPPTIPDQRSRPGDERFRWLAGRRPVVEAVLAAAADDEADVVVRRGTRVDRLLADADVDRPVHVRGVRTSDGTEHLADLVVDATGRRSPVAGWLTALGASPSVVSQDRGFAYYTRYYRGDLPALRAPGLSPMGSFSLLVVPGDADTWSVTVFGTAGDPLLRWLRQPDAFERVVGACPLHAHWLHGEPLTDVLPMGGVLDRYRRYVVDGVPVATGLAAVGDAWACTNPSAGRGLSIGAAHAQLLRDTVAAHDRADEAFALDWDARTERVVAPFVHQQAKDDAVRVAEMQAHRAGTPPPDPDPGTARLSTAAMHDAEAFRALLDTVMCLATTDEALSRPGLAAAVALLGRDRPEPLPGPGREQLAALVGQTRTSSVSSPRTT